MMQNNQKTNWIIGAALFGGFLLSLWLNLTGLALHQWLGVAVGALAIYHLAAHWRWIVTTARKHILPAPARPAPVAHAQPAAVTSQAGRRDFLRLMAGVSAVALLGGVNAISGLTEGQAEASTATRDAIPQATTPSSATQRTRDSFPSAAGSSGSTSSTCQVQCNKRCSYPGHCRRYVDSNGNGRCDLGECLS